MWHSGPERQGLWPTCPKRVVTPVGATSSTLFNHYSLLGTTEQLLGLPALGLAASATTLTSAFNL